MGTRGGPFVAVGGHKVAGGKSAEILGPDDFLIGRDAHGGKGSGCRKEKE